MRSDPCPPCGLCCKSYLVPVFGHDVWRITTGLGLAPEAFVFIAEQEQPDALGFRLEAGGATFGLALLKTEPIAATSPCIFLEEDATGSRCRVYHHRPITCRAYPMSKLGGEVYQRATTLCPPGAWTPDDLAAGHWRETLQRLRMERDVYVEAVARWNAAVERWRPPGALPASLFGQYLVTVYRGIAELEASIGPAEWTAALAEWAHLPPRDATEAGNLIARSAEPAWIGVFRRLREVIDRAFPELEPLPFQRLVVETGPA